MVYNYTRPRGPIAAMEKGPGPSYGLPPLTGYKEHDPRSVYVKNPAYQFGLPVGSEHGPYSPGPCYYPDSHVFRTGRNEGRKHTIYPRLAELKRFEVPAPWTYEARPMSLVASKAPAYTFGLNCSPPAGDEIPAPNAYSTSGTLGRSLLSGRRQQPAYSIYGRSKKGGFDEDFKKTPGPGSYGAVEVNRYMTKRPQYSLIGRNMPPGDNTQKPGPGAHAPETVMVHKKSPPKFSFGIRHSDYEAPLIVRGIDS